MRYEVYVDELQRAQRYADHERRVIEEPLDHTGQLLAALDGNRLVGTLRINYARTCDLGEYSRLYEMARVGAAHLGHTSVVTKLLLVPEYRNTTLAYRLSMAAYRLGLRDGILFDFIDVYPARVSFFERLGYRVHVPEAMHPEYGSVVVMKLAMHDAEHFKRVGSPFLRYLETVRAAA